VVVRLRAGVEADGAAGLHTVGQPEVGQQLERGIDGRERDPRHRPMHPLEHLLGGAVPAEGLERAVHGEPLGRHAHPERAERGAEVGGAGGCRFAGHIRVP
jgi:hypothetical protein